MKKQRTVAVYPGTFDPVHDGHLDILKRIKEMSFDKIICAVGVNTGKTPLFSLEERLDMLYNTVPKNVEVEKYPGLMVDYIKDVRKREKGHMVVIRGFRLITDFEFEGLLFFNNKKLDSSIDTILIPPKQELLHISSTVIRDVVRMNPSYIDTLDVPKYVKKKLKEKYG